MVDFAEMKSVKRDFGDRILRAGLLHGPSGFATANTVKAAIANSGANAHAVSIGYKIVDGKETDTLAIRIHVTQKLAASISPKQNLFPKDINGHLTDIIAPFDNFAISGDSGSLVVGKDTAHAVGLYFAGPQSGVYGVANDIGSVLSELEIALVLGSA